MATDTETAKPEWLEQLTEILDPGIISTEKDVCEEFGTDRWHAMAMPAAVIQAESVEDVQETLRFANERNIPVTTRGAGVGYVGGCVPVQGGILLSVKHLDRILEINPADGVAVIEPGVILNDLVEAFANKAGTIRPIQPA